MQCTTYIRNLYRLLKVIVFLLLREPGPLTTQKEHTQLTFKNEHIKKTLTWSMAQVTRKRARMFTEGHTPQNFLVSISEFTFRKSNSS